MRELQRATEDDAEGDHDQQHAEPQCCADVRPIMRCPCSLAYAEFDARQFGRTRGHDQGADRWSDTECHQLVSNVIHRHTSADEGVLGRL